MTKTNWMHHLCIFWNLKSMDTKIKNIIISMLYSLKRKSDGTSKPLITSLLNLDNKLKIQFHSYYFKWLCSAVPFFSLNTPNLKNSTWTISVVTQLSLIESVLFLDLLGMLTRESWRKIILNEILIIQADADVMNLKYRTSVSVYWN